MLTFIKLTYLDCGIEITKAEIRMIKASGEFIVGNVRLAIVLSTTVIILRRSFISVSLDQIILI
jgi:hypothetical protein